MEIRVQQKDLAAELAPMQGIVERRTTIPVLSHILMRAGSDRLEMAATDLDVSLTSSCAAEVSGQGALAVQARKLFDVVRSLGDQEVVLAVDDKRLNLTAGKSRFKLNGLAEEDFPTLPAVEAEDEFELPFDEFKQMVRKVLFAVSVEQSRFQLNGALLKFKKGGLEIVATDGHRLALVENAVKGAAERDGVLVPRKALQELQRFEGGDKIVFQRGQHHLSFKLGHRQLACRVLEGSFPDYEKVISRDNERRAVFNTRNLGEAVRRVALVTGERSRTVRLDLKDGRLELSATNPDLGQAVEEVECDYSGDEVKLGLNPDYLGDFLGAVDTDSVQFELRDENTQCVGLPVDGSDSRYVCVIMPMRI